jgi:hypothetical protein
MIKLDGRRKKKMVEWNKRRMLRTWHSETDGEGKEHAEYDGRRKKRAWQEMMEGKGREHGRM